MSKPTKKSSKIHPSSPHHHLALLLPAAILSLTAALSPEDTEVLAYLISCQSANRKSLTKAAGGDHDDHARIHPPVFGCNCFRCYTSFWSRWDTSPNRETIHDIIEAYEEGLSRKKSSKGKKRRKNNIHNKESEDQYSSTEPAEGVGNGREASVTHGGGDGEVGSPEKGSPVRKVIGFIGEKIWSAWNRV